MSRRNGVLAVALLVLLIGLVVFATRPSATDVRARPSPVAAAPKPPTRIRAAPAPVEPPLPEGTEVRCEVGRALEGRACRLLSPRADEPHRFSETPFVYDGAAMVFTPDPEARSAVLRCPEIEPLRFVWTTGADGSPVCAPDGPLPAPADAPLSGRVRGANDLPEGTVFLEGCGAAESDPVDADGSFFVQTEGGPCTMRAWRQSGMLRLPGPWVAVEAKPGVDVDVALSVPTFAPAGMGIGFRATDDGVTVTGVRSGSPAESAGLDEGDVILMIDGQSTEGMDTDGFLQAGIGPEGSEVQLEGTTLDGEPFDLTLTRRPIDPG